MGQLRLRLVLEGGSVVVVLSFQNTHQLFQGRHFCLYIRIFFQRLLFVATTKHKPLKLSEELQTVPLPRLLVILRAKLSGNGTSIIQSPRARTFGLRHLEHL